MPAAQQFAVVASGTLDEVADDPPEPLLVLRPHRSPDTSVNTPSAAIQLTAAADDTSAADW